MALNQVNKLCRALLTQASLCVLCLILIAERAYAKAAPESVYSIFPYGGLSFLNGESIKNMNQRLGNSARLSQPYAFGRQFGYGIQTGFWGRDQRQYYGLNVFMTEKELTGTSTFQGVSGTSSLKIAGYMFEYGFRFVPFGQKFKPSKPKGIRDRIKITATASAGYFSVANQNDIEDSANDTLVSYHYDSARLGVGGGVKAAVVVLPWLHVIVFDARAFTLLSLSGQVTVASYRVAGRDESSIAQADLQKDLGSAILGYGAAWGVEFCL